MALDNCIRAAAPGWYLTSFRRLLESIGPQDAEPTIYGQAEALKEVRRITAIDKLSELPEPAWE